VTAFSQVNSPSPEIEIGTRISAGKIPLEDSLIFVVRLVWQGEQDQYLIEPIQAPALENLHLLGLRAETDSYQEEGVTYTRKEYFYSMIGDTVGPAGIGAVAVTYYDTDTDQANQFTSQAYRVAIIPPLNPEKSRFLWFLLAIAVLLGLGYVLRIYRRVKVPPKETSTPKSPEEEAREKVTTLRLGGTENLHPELKNIVIRYLEKKSGLRLRGKTTSDVVSLLDFLPAEKKEIVREVLQACDQAQYLPGPVQPEAPDWLLAKLDNLWEPD
jgi:hypothetical protein